MHRDLQPCSPDDRRHHGINEFVRRYHFKSALRRQHLGCEPICLYFLSEVAGVRLAGHHRIPRFELGALGQQQIGLGGCAESENLEAIRMPGDDIQRVHTDRASRAEDGDALFLKRHERTTVMPASGPAARWAAVHRRDQAHRHDRVADRWSLWRQRCV